MRILLNALILALPFILQVSYGQTPDDPVPAGTVTATVTDSSGAAVSDARAELSGAAQRSASSDGRGRVALSSLPPGQYTLTVSLAGFSAREVSFELTAGGSKELAIELALAPMVSFVEAVSKVKEETLNVPFLVSTVSGRELRDTGAGSFDEALRTVAGLQHATQGNVYTRISTRGLRDTADVLVLLDGVPFRQANGSADLTMIPVNMLQGMEFVKGPASSVYGRSAIGGTAQFFTIPEARPTPSAELVFGVGSFSTFEGQGSFHVPWSRGRIAGASSLARSDGYQKKTGRDTNFGTLAVDHTFSKLLSLRLNYWGSDVEAGRGSIIPLRNGQPLYGITPEDNSGIDGAGFSGQLHSFTGKVDTELSPRLLLTNTFNFNRYDRFVTGGITILPAPTVSNKGWSETNTRQDAWIHDTVLRWDAAKGRVKSSLLGGATYEGNDQRQASPTFTNPATFTGPDYVNPVANAANGPKGIRGAVVNALFNQTVQSAYLQDRVQIDRVGLTLGLRFDHFDQLLRRLDTPVQAGYDKWKLSPRVAADVALLRGERLDVVAFGNFAQGFRPQVPALSTQNNVIIPQLLRPEVTRNVEGGLRVRSGRLSGEASYFNMRKIDGQRSFRSGPDDFTFVNATSRVRGFEAELRARLPKGGHSLFANYSHHNARHIEFRPTLTTDFSGYRVRMSPANIAGGGVTLQLARFTWTNSTAYVGSRPLRDNVVNPQWLPSYTLFTSSLGVRFGNVSAVVSATNLTDRFYIADDFSSQDAGCPGVPRSVTLRVRYRF